MSLVVGQALTCSLQCWTMFGGGGIWCHAGPHFLGKPEHFSTDVVFLQSTFEFAPDQVIFSRRAFGFARYPKHSVYLKSLVLRTNLVDSSEDRNSFLLEVFQISWYIRNLHKQSYRCSVRLRSFWAHVCVLQILLVIYFLIGRFSSVRPMGPNHFNTYRSTPTVISSFRPTKRITTLFHILFHLLTSQIKESQTVDLKKQKQFCSCTLAAQVSTHYKTVLPPSKHTNPVLYQK